MKVSTLLTGTALAALLCTGALAQEQKRTNEGPQGTQQETQQGTPQRQQKSEQPATPKGHAQGQAQGQQQPGKQAEPKTQQPTQKQATPNGKDTPATQKKADTPKADTSKSAADKAPADSNKSAETPRTDRQGTADNKSGADAKGKTQISDAQRDDVHRDILKESNVNRVNVNVQVRIGERVPRDVRLAPLPAAVISIVPAYRSYRYFVVEERVVIVDPASYEIVEVIMPGNSGGQVASHGAGQHLTLTAEEREIVLREVDIRSSRSTLGIGALSEGADVPRSVELMEMPSAVVQKVSKLRGYKYFVAEQRLAIVDPNGAKIELVIDTKN